ncbi:hypothetical protein ACR78F_00095 [Sphingobacterium spiritivorum]|uniref:hypothetical protein n=1 Tax=Sphingobacterium spiritivorum TaxID=258 RepID=UPI003DA49031
MTLQFSVRLLTVTLECEDKLIYTFYHDENGKPYLALNSMSSDFYILGAVLNFEEDKKTKHFSFTWEYTDSNNVCTQLEADCYKFSLGKGEKKEFEFG